MMNPRSVRFSRIGIVVAVALMVIGLGMLRQSSSLIVRAQTGLGGPLPGLTPMETTLFNTGDVVFAKPWDAKQGFGPVATQLRCNLCHGTPVDGGSSPTLKTTFFGKINQDGSFNPMLDEGGIVLQTKTVAKFKPSCVLAGEVVPADATIRALHVPPPLFGLGLINSIPEADIEANAIDKGLGIHGTVNWVNDENGVPHVGRFGHKAEDADLLQFVAGALQHDIGITNPINPSEDLPQGNAIPQNCDLSQNLEDDGRQMLAAFQYVLYLAPSPPNEGDFQHGEDLFNTVGCALCHIPSFTTDPHVSVRKTWNPPYFFYSKALSSQPVNLYSDLLLHDMGTTLQDGIQMSPAATGRMFRTAPLWGVSVKLANNIGLLHSGISFTVDDAIRKHSGPFSEANTVIDQYTALAPEDQQALIDFVSSL